MRYHNITKDDMRNGDGLRVVLWVAGCNHCCKNCQNPITWDPDGGLAFDDAANLLNIYVPSESVDAYKAADGWKDYADKIQSIS